MEAEFTLNSAQQNVEPISMAEKEVSQLLETPMKPDTKTLVSNCSSFEKRN